MKRNFLAIVSLLILSSCNKGEDKIIKMRIDIKTNGMTVNCVDVLEISFRGVGNTSITGSSSGTWKEGVEFKTEKREGENIFFVTISGDYIRSAILENSSTLPFQFDIPIAGLDSEGTFEVRGNWKYNNFITGEAYTMLQIPVQGDLFVLTIKRTTQFQTNLCPTQPPPDADETEEVIDNMEFDYDISDLPVDDFIETDGEDEAEEEEEGEELELQEN